MDKLASLNLGEIFKPDAWTAATMAAGAAGGGIRAGTLVNNDLKMDNRIQAYTANVKRLKEKEEASRGLSVLDMIKLKKDEFMLKTHQLAKENPKLSTVLSTLAGATVGYGVDRFSRGLLANMETPPGTQVTEKTASIVLSAMDKYASITGRGTHNDLSDTEVSIFEQTAIEMGIPEFVKQAQDPPNEDLSQYFDQPVKPPSTFQKIKNKAHSVASFMGRHPILTAAGGIALGGGATNLYKNISREAEAKESLLNTLGVLTKGVGSHTTFKGLPAEHRGVLHRLTKELSEVERGRLDKGTLERILGEHATLPPSPEGLRKHIFSSPPSAPTGIEATASVKVASLKIAEALEKKEDNSGFWDKHGKTLAMMGIPAVPAALILRSYLRNRGTTKKIHSTLDSTLQHLTDMANAGLSAKTAEALKKKVKSSPMPQASGSNTGKK